VRTGLYLAYWPWYVETAERSGHGTSARRVQELFGAGDRAGAAAALSDDLIDRSAICCRPGELGVAHRLVRAGRGHDAAGHAVRRPAEHRRRAGRHSGGSLA
jgi:hypothetical protein